MVAYSVYQASFKTKTYRTPRLYVGYTGDSSLRADKLRKGGTFWTKHILKDSFQLVVVHSGIDSIGHFSFAW